MQNEHQAADSAGHVVYVREVGLNDVSEDMRFEAEAAGLDKLFVIGSETGEQLAVVANKRIAFEVAVQNKMTPQSVH